jgi:molybdate transport system substrate-binding protein
MTVKLITSMASRELLRELALLFAAKTSQPVDVQAAGGVDVAKRVRAGEAVDIVVLARNSIDELVRAGALLAASVTDIARSGIAVAVRETAAAPDISDEEAVRRAVVAAPSLSYSTGPSGVYLEKKFESWGILDLIRPRIVVPSPGVPVASLIATGKATLGFQQLSELISAQGINVLGPLPRDMQLLTTFSGAIASISGNTTLAGEVLQFMSSSEADGVKPRWGMEPCIT